MNPAAPLPAGERLNGYEIQRLLSADGSFALVYVATDLDFDRVTRRRDRLLQNAEDWRIMDVHSTNSQRLAVGPSAGPQVVVKEFLPGDLARRAADGRTVEAGSGKSRVFEWSRARFVDEARFLMSHSHPYVVSVFEVMSGNNTNYMVMELLSGGSLADRSHNAGANGEREVRQWLLPVLRALQSVESRGVDHLDLSPSNIAFRSAGGDPVLLDFGAARIQARHRSRATRLIVNDGFAAPEKYRATSQALDSRADVYALGGVVNFVLTGERPYAAMERTADPEKARGISPQAAAARVRRASKAFVNVIDLCFALDRDRRPADAAVVERMLGPWEIDAVAPVTTAPNSGIRTWSPHRQAVAIFFALLLVLLILLLAAPGLEAAPASVPESGAADAH